MTDLAREVTPVNIEDELKQSYLDYAMSVIVGRALPDVRDGLKPVHRRVLFAMHELNNDWNKPYKKSARVVGDVIGKYHPHGDSAVYDTIVRMAQPFSLRYMLVDGQGNFGSIDGDSAAAMRYTEVRMAKIAHELLADLDKETVDFVDNYDGTEKIPDVMPTRVPNLLVNGSSGIAVGMATNIPPHNLGEVVDGCLALIDDDSLTPDDLMEYIKGPDFPTAGIINGRAGIVQAYRTGRGRVYMRARAEIEQTDKSGKEAIIVHEIPYQVNKARLIEKIAELVKDKKIEGITELRDESDKEGMRIVIELRRGENAEVVLNNLYQQTQMETVFGINTVALVDGQPKTLNLRELLDAFIRHRREVVTRRTVFELRKAREKAHLLEGLAVALSNIDPVIELIKGSPSGAEAKEKLLAKGWTPGDVMQMLERAGGENAARPDGLDEQYGLREGLYYLSPEQAQAILDLRLQKLTGLEREKLISDYQELLEQIAELMLILADPQRLMQVIRDELKAIREEYADERRSEIVTSRLDLSMEDLIAEETVVVTLSNGGYAKMQPIDTYRAQKRGGRGKSAGQLKDEDYVEHLLVAGTHDTLLLFTDAGKVFWLRTFELPQGGRASRGKPIVNLLPALGNDERITAILRLDAEMVRQQKAAGVEPEADEDDVIDADEVIDETVDGDEAEAVVDTVPGPFIFMATSSGIVKRTALANFARPRSSGLIAVKLQEGEHLVNVAITHGDEDVMLVARNGKAVRFHQSKVRVMSRLARGVRGIKLAEGVDVISLIVPQEEGQILTASENGYGKRTPLTEYPTKGRGGQGVIAMVINERNGELVGATQVFGGEDIMLISNQGTLVRTGVDQISTSGRNTQGVRLIRLGEGEKLCGLATIPELEGDEEDIEDGEVLEEGDVTSEAPESDASDDAEE
ncbi:DNA gyrase subunit A [Alcanivorax sp. HI0033]|uniref:DNA gyrase subunit A n=1 Tax=unclassified Alcanivorax TaxID=2638842 RepID=UPI0007B831CB|nr:MULTISPECIES: DNA gyrase subunit A [unclassified Alcanivorax]KZX79531.1 DNA gyrase subunit A [Alcanivorax sp. HI0011]KZX79945.1 DNA gyrase subunit A [Alcanivorax sp. HI0013]KZY14482.1 DNA gyrase subunit A [Alcanivorax sp. HI0035]KZX67271.1 DNA gyrase subunit A [Alcanivorax sp. HI0007]KZX71377.1 DNA gyrase subunit A [Alcanivorax sp. HI0003]